MVIKAVKKSKRGWIIGLTAAVALGLVAAALI